MSTASKLCSVCGTNYKTEKDFLSGTSGWRVCSEGHLWFECSCHSTLMLPKGKYPWYNPTLGMSPEAGSVFNRLASVKDLPNVPSHVMQLLQVIDDPKTDTVMLAKEVKREPFIAEEVRKIATNLRNQRMPGSQPFANLEHAVTYIGLKALKEIILASALRTFRAHTNNYSVDVFWREAYACAAIAEHVTRLKAPNLNADEVFHAACLLNIGKLIGAICLPAQVGSSRVDLQACKLEYSIVSPK